MKKEIEQSELKEAILKSKKSFLMVGFFSFFVNLLMLVPPLYMLQLYDRVLTSRSENTLIMLTLIVVVLFITMALLEIVRSKMLVRIGNYMDDLLSTRIFDSLFKVAQRYPGKASSLPLGDLSQVRQFMTGNGVFAFFDAPWLPIYIAILYLFHPYFAFFAIGAVIVLFIFALINEYTTKEKLAEANSLSRESTVFVDSNLRNAEVVNAMGMQDNVRSKWEKKYLSFLSAQSDASSKAGIWSNISKSSRMLFQSMILGFGGYLAINNEITPGMMIAGSIIMGRALAPLDLIINSWKGFSGARTSYQRLGELLKEFPKDKEYMQLPEPKGEVLLENVFVKPPNSELYSLKEVNLKIDQGDIVGIIGPSAAGKSSLARAMLGLWPLALGTARLDKADIMQWDKRALGKYIGYLPQDIELFEGTISENIARFNEVDAQKVVEAAQIAGVHEMILRLPDGYDTVIGAGGASLSGGQRQRVGFARAVYDSPVLVVLDEPNSNLDEQGELALVNAINKLKEKNTTVVLITHRPSILQATNKLAVMRQGTIEAYGNTEDILSKLSGQRKLAQPKKPEQKISLSKPGS